ncbi:zinc-finger domain-containing protein [Croceicoccus mobilis]|uniref:Zinc finger CHCC-type domain-containing protein n=1 Tax=Croceicoccus mobilis TaxID=1703339 RepID=A0A916YQV2_9SPHN|nr:zinc-finger domain-containing protein [Croceicoccus mobilis]GGD56826.1 hypothetical protein GCM10010990_02530 [Croceicoccus mobilis]
MSTAPETIYTDSTRVKCDGATDIRAGSGYAPSALGHPRVWLEIDEKGYVECGYCDRRFVLKGGPAHDVTGVNPAVGSAQEEGAAG